MRNGLMKSVYKFWQKAFLHNHILSDFNLQVNFRTENVFSVYAQNSDQAMSKKV